MIKRIHPIAGIVAFLIILIFWLSTTVSELFASVDTIVFVKRAIPWGLLLLLPALAMGTTEVNVLRKKQHRLGAADPEAV